MATIRDKKPPKLVDQLAATKKEREARGEFLFSGAGSVIKAHRQARNLTLEAVATRLDVNRSTIFRYEQDKTPLSDYAVTRFAEVFELEPEALMMECVQKIMPDLADTSFGQLLKRVVDPKPAEI